MRVYEFSKKVGVSNKEVLEFLRASGLDVPSHMAVLSPAAEALLEKKFLAAVGPVTQKKAEKKTSLAPEALTKEKDILPDSSLQRAKEQVAPPEPLQKKEIKKSIEKKEQKIQIAARAPGLTLRPMTVGEAAEQLNKPVSEVILVLLKKGMVAAKNQVLSEKTIILLAQHYGITPTEIEAKHSATLIPGRPSLASDGDFVRAPIVVVIGHVDHGKTSLLDFIRKTRVAAREKGGITQHLGAYAAETAHGKLIFLDTPGHEAFSMMRARGIRVADIAILVVAADDGVMPQTIEAINMAREVGLPIVVAINKIDKVSSKEIENVKRTLSQYDLLPEEWGGQTVIMPISAKVGTGIGELLEMIVLQAQLMELKANITVLARGFVLESKLEKGLGPVATVICHNGILKIGDNFACGSTYGRVNVLIDSLGQRVTQVQPSMPVLVAGFNELPRAGDAFEVISAEELKKVRSMRQAKTAEARLAQQQQITSMRQAQGAQIVYVLLKVDGISSQEALLNAIGKLSGKTFNQISVAHVGVGAVVESDVKFAADTQAIIYGLHVRAEPNAAALAQKLSVDIRLFDIIYKLLEDLQVLAEQGKPVKMITKKIGEAIVLKVFPIKGVGVIAGSKVTTGRFSKDGKVVVWRGRQRVGEGKIESLQREKKSVKEVHAGFECGFLIREFSDWQPDDRVECFLEMPEEMAKGLV